MTLSLRALLVAALLLVAAPKVALAKDPPATAIVNGINQVLIPRRPDFDGILTARDNTLYVQCVNRAEAAGWRCEAAGLEGEPWLRNVLTKERQKKLLARGFKPDTTYGNFVRTFPRSTKPANLAGIIFDVLSQIYGADVDNIDALIDWLPVQPCHPRLIAGRDRGGSIATPSWGFAKDTAQGCGIVTNTDRLNYDNPAAERPGTPPEGEVDLDARYGAEIAVQLKRLEGGGKHIWAIFDAGIPYLQCQFDKEDNAIYCEAASEDAAGAPLARILTPVRRQKLLDEGFEPPGKVVNFRRFYPLDRFDDTAVAHAILAALHDGYGYGGAPAMMLQTEMGGKKPL